MSSTAPASRASELIGPAGPFARALDVYEPRAGQLDMAAAVERTLAEERILFCEAGTGTGKTLAYLVPALLSQKKIIISTATRALQEQIFFRDLPLVERALGRSADAALMKGLSNYVCRRRLAEFRGSPEGARPVYARALEAIGSWIDETETGDFTELAGLGEEDPIRHEVGSSSDTRLGQNCQFYDECFVTRMRRQAEQARVVVVNHHLFFADLALRGPHPGRVLPDYDAVIFDEAHQLEDIATAFFGMRVSKRRLERLLEDAERALTAAGATDPLFGGEATRRTVESLRQATSSFFEALRVVAGREERITLERDVFSGDVASAWHALDAALEALGQSAEVARGRASVASSLGKRGRIAPSEALEVTARRCEDVRSALALVVEGGSGRVTWFEQSGRSAALSSSPIDLSYLFRERLFESVPSVVLTSATLSTEAERPANDAEPPRSRFSYFRSRYGLAGSELAVEELVVPSPFDFAANALLYTPRDLPPPNAPSFLGRATTRIAELIEITGGGAFVLTTSRRTLHALSQELPRLLRGRRLYVQGTRPKPALIQSFRADGDAVLLATQSFWEGVDVPGRALRLVVLEKIPFGVPTDPVLVARSRELEAGGQNPFMKLHVPAAAIALKQGFGRLIRTQRDVGVVALLDERVHRRGYGKAILSALPGARRTDELPEVRRFWSEVTARGD